MLFFIGGSWIVLLWFQCRLKLIGACKIGLLLEVLGLSCLFLGILKIIKGPVGLNRLFCNLFRN